EEAFERGADVAVLPELLVPGYVADRERLLPLAEPIDGPTVTAWRAVAAAAGGHVAGGFCERAGDDLFNTAVLVGPDGIALHYRKLHLFAGEKHAFRPGDRGLPVVVTPFGTVGVCVCYDLRFVETVRILALRGAELVLVPTAWVPGFDRIRFDEDGMPPQVRGALLQANLNQVFIACASQAGAHGDLEFLGSSMVADPRGRCLLGPLSADEDAVAVVKVDLDEVGAAQTRIPLVEPRADRRTDVYGIAVAGEDAPL
ncbi:MAG: nitrilase-related carbon-nitrogen hydrolase, partial [Solirubrobacteraceae bacterium]